MTDVNVPRFKAKLSGYQVLFLVKVTGLFAAYTSAKRPVDLEMAHAYRAALERQGQAGKIVAVPDNKVVEEWSSDPFNCT